MNNKSWLLPPSGASTLLTLLWDVRAFRTPEGSATMEILVCLLVLPPPGLGSRLETFSGRNSGKGQAAGVRTAQSPAERCIPAPPLSLHPSQL